MRLLKAQKQTRSADIHRHLAQFRTHDRSAPQPIDHAGSRREPETFASRSIAADNYEVWLAQREAEQQTEQPEVRWVFRHERITRPARTSEVRTGRSLSLPAR
jgi:hypothetical protein